MYFLDYTGPPGYTERVAALANKVVVLDHHKTAQESLQGRSNLPDNMDINIDMHRSGATLARDYFGSIRVRLLHCQQCQQPSTCFWDCDSGLMAALGAASTLLHGEYFDHEHAAHSKTPVDRSRSWLNVLALAQDAKVNQLIEYIEDGDLWRWQLPNAKAFYAGFHALKLELDANKNPAIFERLLQLSLDDRIEAVRS